MVLMMDVTRSIGYALRFYLNDWSGKTIIGKYRILIFGRAGILMADA